MRLFHHAWRRLTHTRALELSSGKLETIFFESVYRVTYLSGFSSSDRNIAYLMYSNSLKFLIISLIYFELWYFFTIPWALDGVIDSVNILIILFSAMYKYKKLIQLVSTMSFVRIHPDEDHRTWSKLYSWIYPKTDIGNKDNFKNLASSMESPYFDLSTSERRRMLDEWQKRNEIYLRIILGFGTGALLAWHTYPLVDDLDYNLMIPVRLPFHYNTPLRYTLTYTAVLIVFSYIAYFVMVNDLIMQAHVMHLLCQFAVLNDCFRNVLRDCCDQTEDFPLLSHNLLFMTDNFKTKYIKKIDNLTKQHQRILNNVLTLGAILSGPMLAQLAVSTTLISFIGYQVATNTENYTKSIMSLLFLGYNMSVLYIICRWCEELKTQSEYIGEAVYCSRWERGAAAVPGVRARLLLIITRANKPLVLQAAGMYELSLASYSNIIKTSYSALTLLLRLRHEHD